MVLYSYILITLVLEIVKDYRIYIVIEDIYSIRSLKSLVIILLIIKSYYFSSVDVNQAKMIEQGW